MKLANSFTTETRELFRDTQYCCFLCGTNGGGMTEINHTLGRESNSPLNGSVLCRECHSHIGHSEEEHIKLLTKTLHYLHRQHYKFTDEDDQFIRDNFLLFARIINKTYERKL